MKGDRRYESEGPFQKTRWGCGNWIDVFAHSVLRNTPAECRIRIAEFQKVYDSLSEGFKKRGLSGSQITDTLWARLSGTCPRCGWRISGEDLGNLWMMGSFGFDRVVVSGPGRAPRFGKEYCPNETCSSSEIVLRWRVPPADNLSPRTANGERLLGRVPDGVMATFTSRDGLHVACMAPKRGKLLVIVDGLPGPEYDGIIDGHVVFSQDGKRVAYGAQKDNKHLVVVSAAALPRRCTRE
jgi:hypothetical protein